MISSISACYKTRASFQLQTLSSPEMQTVCSATKLQKRSKMNSLSELPLKPYVEVQNRVKNDPSSEKVALLDGVILAENGELHLMNVVHEAERRIHERKTSHGYQDSLGCDDFRTASAEVMFGKDSPVLAEDKVATAQTVSGTGALCLGAKCLQRSKQRTEIYVSDPCWEYYDFIFPEAGLAKKTYRYFDPNTKGLDFEGMCTDIANAPSGSIIVLQGCAHNPTGCDPTKEQWGEICEICKEKDHMPFFDVAYQGFASGSLEEDAYAPRLFAQNGMEFLVAQSYSKNFCIYGERVGALHFVLNEKEVVQSVLAHLRDLIDASYDCPPVHGAYVVREILKNPYLYNQWTTELREVVARLVEIRKELYNHSKELLPEMDWSAILLHKGMFTFLGLTTKQIDYLMEHHHVYLAMEGRIAVGLLSKNGTQYLAKALADTFKNC